jgi:CO/xanthine dehydrogenase FAD-binding subunit
MAGGTDVIARIRAGKTPEAVIDIKELPELRGISFDQSRGVWIGALTTMRELYQNEGLRRYFPALVEAARMMGCYEIQGRATIGGNIVNASPVAETAPPLLIYEAEIVILSAEGERSMPLRNFWLGPGKTVLGRCEIVIGFKLPFPPAESHSIYRRLARIRGMDLATIGMGLLVGSGGQPDRPLVRVAVGAMAPTPVRVSEVEDFLAERGLGEEILTEAKALLARVLKPKVDDFRATPAYKQDAVGSLLEIALEDLGAIQA